MAKNVFQSLGKKPRIEYIPLPEDLKRTYQNYTCADMEKFQKNLEKQSLTFTPDFTFESAIDDYVKNYLVKDERW